MPRYLISFVAVLVTAFLALGASGIAAQDGTPEGSSRVIAPEECQVEPRSAAAVAEILDSAGEAADVVQTPLPIPLGRPADPETKAEINALGRELIACFNAGDLLRATALMSDAGVRSFFNVDADIQVDVAAVQSGLETPPTPFPANDQSRLIAVTDISVLDDDRVGAFIVFNDPLNPPRGPATLLMLLAPEGDGWVVDDFISFTVPPQGTPTAGEATPVP